MSVLSVPNPWAYCAGCGGDVEHRDAVAGVNSPCGCRAQIASACPSWEPFHGCRCSDPGLEEVESAVALQEALEQDEFERRRMRAVERMARGLDLPLEVIRSGDLLPRWHPPMPDGDDLRAGAAIASILAPAKTPQLGDDLFDQAQQLRSRFRAFLSWAAVIVAILTIAGLFAGGGPW